MNIPRRVVVALAVAAVLAVVGLVVAVLLVVRRLSGPDTPAEMPARVAAYTVLVPCDGPSEALQRAVCVRWRAPGPDHLWWAYRGPQEAMPADARPVTLAAVVTVDPVEVASAQSAPWLIRNMLAVGLVVALVWVLILALAFGNGRPG